MKKLIILSVLMSLISMPVTAFGGEVEELVYPDAPVWGDYVPQKYENPRTDFKRGNAIAEMIAGVVLTDLLITAPIGVPMICHSATKLKNISYAKKKVKFENGLMEAESIIYPDEREEYYEQLINNLHLKKRNN